MTNNAETLPSPRLVSTWLSDMTDGEIRAIFTAAPYLAERLKAELDAYFAGADKGRPPWSRNAILSLRSKVGALPDIPGATDRDHLASMLDRVEADPSMSHAKLCRWLGWIQCAITAAGVASLEQMMAHNVDAYRGLIAVEDSTEQDTSA